jgi:predicted enzyme related to lactoylglutathione lyase
VSLNMTVRARYVHTNLVARDWRALAAFYQRVFGCKPVAERDLSGEWLDDATSLHDARIQGIHLRLPGYGDEGPTLEVFQYANQPERLPTAPNRPGFGHIAFAVDDVPTVCDEIIAAGGDLVGEIVTVEIPGAGQIVFAYAIDPEGNIIEVQQWSSI